MHLVYRLREHAAETGEDWVIEVTEESGAVPLVVLPRSVPMLRQPSAPPSFRLGHTGASRYPAREAQDETGSRRSPG
jgi:hypothetical protein